MPLNPNIESDDFELSMIEEQRLSKEDKSFEYHKSKNLKKKNSCYGKRDRNQRLSPCWLWTNDVEGRYKKQVEKKAEAKFHDWPVTKLTPTKTNMKSHLGFLPH